MRDSRVNAEIEVAARSRLGGRAAGGPDGDKRE